MQINIYQNPMQKAYLFGTAVLYSGEHIPQEDVPQYWSCYELRGTRAGPDKPYALVDMAMEYFAGSVLSPLPLKKEAAQSRLIRGKLELTPEYVQLTQFCSEYQIPMPKTPIRHMFRPASTTESGLFYALPPEKDAIGAPTANQRSVCGGERRKERNRAEFSPSGGNGAGGVSSDEGAIGHVRIDFGRDGDEFWHTWWPRGPEELNTPEFKEELGKVVNDLRLGVLKDLPSMRRYCWGRESGAITGGSCCQNYGFVLETDRYLYRLRCNPVRGDYQAYLTCFDLRQQELDQAQEQDSGPVLGGMG